MQKIIIVVMVLAVIACQGCSTLRHADPWSPGDKAREACWLVLHAVDYGTTLDIADQPDKYYEVNPILGEHPSRERVHTYMIGTAILHPIITNYLPQRKRMFGLNVPVRAMWQNLSIGVSSACVGNNLHIGLRMAF